ncbi:MAG TPA: hypothetical protein VK181_25190 [Rhizobium sp.]|nr:hypothetical protein [Rhizobium sp.]
MPKEKHFEISIFVPEKAPAFAPMLSREEIGEHVLTKGFATAVGGIARVGADKVVEQWRGTVDTLVGLGATVSERAEGWHVEEIEVGFTLSASGELLFIAEAGAEASITFKLKPKAAGA